MSEKKQRRTPQESPWPVRLPRPDKGLLREVAKAQGETPHAMSVRVLREYAQARAKELHLVTAEESAA